jgi:catechol 2,3-dioxygenase-like lactoylglutathione lyase family enzyme
VDVTLPRVENISTVLLVSKDAARLAVFYRDTLGLPLREDREGGRARWACALGELQISIHPQEDFDEEPIGSGAIRLGFAVKDIDEMVARLEERGVELLFSPRDLGWGKMTAVRDPDGNVIELTQLGDDWFRHLDKDAPPVSWPRRFKLAPVGR